MTRSDQHDPMTTPLLSTDLPEACATVDLDREPPVLAPDGPADLAGNHWYACTAAVGATAAPHEVDLLWPPAATGPGSDYAGNHSFADVLDRIIFIDHSDGRWQRIENVQRHDEGARFTLPAGPAGRRVAVGMPVTWHDLEQLLDVARDHDTARIETIGTAPKGAPIHAITIGGGTEARGTFVISGYQHFSEWAGIRVIKALLQRLLSDSGEPLRRHWRWVIYPCINADALRLGWRGDPHAVDGINLNRDWADFEQPQTQSVRDHLVNELASGPPLLHALDVHQGWHSRDTCGAGMTVFPDGAAEARLIEQQEAFTRYLYERADYTDFIWRHGGVDRPNLAGWITRTFEQPGQTLEVSRHIWRLRADGRWVTPSVDLEYRLGQAIAENLDSFYQCHWE